MSTDIERLWDQAEKDPETIRVNGSLLEQSTKICPSCGIEMTINGCQCVQCGTSECE